MGESVKRSTPTHNYINLFTQYLNMTKIEFLVKDKFSFMYDGYEKFYIVDMDADKIYDIDKMVVKNVWYWKLANHGDKVTANITGTRLNIEKLN